MKYYLKQGLLPLIYMIFMAMIAIGIQLINGLIWLKILLGILNVGLYGVVVCATSFKEGQDALKVQIANDLERREIIRTGEDRPLKLREEYKWYKGFLFGLTACVPLILLLAVHTIVHFAGGSYVGFGAIAGLVYNMFFLFFSLNNASGGETVQVEWYAYYGTLIALPIIMLMTGISYILGARKIILQQKAIREKQRQIYGE